METLLKLNVFVCFLFSVGSEVSGSRGTVIVNQNFYFSDEDWEKLLCMRVWPLDLFLNSEITAANFFLILFFRNRILVILNWRLSTVGESRVTGLLLASLSRGIHWTKKRIYLSLLVEQIYCKFRVLMLLLICSWCKYCSKVKVYFSARVA